MIVLVRCDDRLIHGQCMSAEDAPVEETPDEGAPAEEASAQDAPVEE